MSATKLRELDAWICQNVFGWKRGKMYGNGNGEWDLPDGTTHYWNNTPCFTTSASASDALDDKILEKLDDEGYEIWCRDGVFMMRVNPSEDWTKHPDKKICRALFAKKLFSK